ncbi:MAG: hypothetical protein ACOYMB_04270 [Patescibacteria group bacterium]
MSRKNLDNYHLYNKELGKKFDDFIIREFKRRSDSETLEFLYQKFFKKKLGVAHQRVAQVFIAAKVFGIDTEKHSEELLRLSAVPELLIWSEYAFNWVTDGKNNDSETKYEDNINLITSQYLFTEVTNFLPARMLRRYLELYRWGIFGCLTVEKDLRITNWDAISNESVFWKAYSDNHCIPDVGALYAYCFELVSDYFEIKLDQKTADAIYKIGIYFGRGVQINGDLSDFMIPNNLVCTTEKRPQKDYFIDIRTDRLTYPTWLLLKFAEKNDRKLFKEVIRSAENRAYPDESFYFKVHRCLKKQGMIHKMLEFLKNEKERLSEEIADLKLNQEGTNLWLGSIEILVHNKFQRQIEKDYGLNR